MAELIKHIQTQLDTYNYGLEHGLITQKEYDELTFTLTSDLKLLARQL